MKSILSQVRLALLLTVVLAGTCAQASVDMFLELGDKIKGETQDKEFGPKGACDILAWSWSMSQSGSTHTGSGGGAGKAAFNDLVIGKLTDKATPALMTSLAKGSHIPEVRLTVRKAGEGQRHYVEITLKEVLVASVSLQASGADDRLNESISLNFARVKVEYFRQDPKGATSSGGVFNWDVVKNSPVLADGTNPDAAPATADPGSTISVDEGLRASITYTAGEPTASLSWSSVPGKKYRVSSATVLGESFRTWADFPASTGTTTTVLVPAASLAEFFRVEVLP
jgi:type VI secretion system secreted protein Hcp